MGQTDGHIERTTDCNPLVAFCYEDISILALFALYKHTLEKTKIESRTSLRAEDDTPYL